MTVKLSKLFVSIFVLYVFWFKEVFGNYPVILYGSVIAATVLVMAYIRLLAAFLWREICHGFFLLLSHTLPFRLFALIYSIFLIELRQLSGYLICY